MFFRLKRSIKCLNLEIFYGNFNKICCQILHYAQMATISLKLPKNIFKFGHLTEVKKY